jgi:hypothetical protein
MTCLHQCLGQESTVESLHSRWSSSSQVIADRPPSQPLSRRQMYGPSSGYSENQSHKDPEMGGVHRRENTIERHQQQGNSKWTSGSGVITDGPPLQPLSRRRSHDVGRVQQSGSRWSPGSRATSDTTALSQALARHLMLVGPSNVSALEHSVDKKNQDPFETTIKTLFTSTLLGKSQSRAPNVTGTGLQCAARTA